MQNKTLDADAILSNQKTLRVCQWIDSNKRFPFIQSNDIIERKMARFISNRIRARENKGTMTWYDSDVEIAKANGYSDLFMSHFERDSNKKVHELCQWIKTNGTNPSIKSNSPNEVILSRFMTAKRCAGRVGTAALYDSDIAIAKTYSLESIFELSQEKESNEKVAILCAWIKLNKRIPDDRSDNQAEATLGRFLEYKKDVNRTLLYGEGKRPKGIVYDSDLEMAKSCNMPDLFRIYTNEERSNSRTDELCRWILANKRTPKINPNNKEEHRLSFILYRLRRLHNRDQSFGSDLAIINSNGLRDLCKLKDWKNNNLYLQWKEEGFN